jgi:hypothetical protein
MAEQELSPLQLMAEQYHKFLTANQNILTKLQFQNKCNKLSLVSIQKVHNSVSLSPHLYRNELTVKFFAIV